MDAWTIKRTADWMTGDLAQRGVEGARLDAELILAAALDVRRVDLYLDFQRPLQPDELDVVRALFKRRRAREPMAYLLGYRDFYRERFTVTPDVLIPRPDSEVLVDQALKALEGRAEARHVDVCTGSGCVGLSIAKARADDGKRTTLTLTDLSPAALAVARVNGEALGVEATLLEGDLFDVLDDACADVLTINPPYIAETDFATLMPDVRDYEPKIALVGGSGGDDVLQRIAADASRVLTPEGVLFVEVGVGQAPAFAALLTSSGFHGVRAHTDLGGIERVIEARMSPVQEDAAESHVVLDEVDEVMEAPTNTHVEEEPFEPGPLSAGDADDVAS